MKKVTKKDLNERLLMVETLLGLHRVLPEQISNEQANNAIFRMQCALSSGKELAEREQPKPKQLDQSVFDGLDAQWRFAVMQHNGYVILCNQKPFLSFGGSSWDWNGQNIGAGGDYDASNWQNSLIERDKVELTGSDLCRAMLERGDKYVLCFVSDFSDDCAVNQSKMINLVTHKEGNSIFAKSARWKYAVPINQQPRPTPNRCGGWTMKYRLAWQDTGTIYELISTDLGYAQLRNIKLNTIKWSEVRHLIAHKEQDDASPMGTV